MDNKYTVTYVDGNGFVFVDEGVGKIFEFLAHIATQGYTLVAVQVTA